MSPSTLLTAALDTLETMLANEIRPAVIHAYLIAIKDIRREIAAIKVLAGQQSQS